MLKSKKPLNLYVELAPTVPGKTDLEEVNARHMLTKPLDKNNKQKTLDRQGKDQVTYKGNKPGWSQTSQQYTSRKQWNVFNNPNTLTKVWAKDII